MKRKMTHHMIIRYPIHCRVITTKIKQNKSRNKHIKKHHFYVEGARFYKKDICREKYNRDSPENRIYNMHSSTIYCVTPKRNRKTQIQ
jgi:hypothetical protein